MRLWLLGVGVGLALLSIRYVPRLVPGLQAVELAYGHLSGEVWLTDAEGKTKTRVLTAGHCPNPLWLEWSPRGDRLVCTGRDPENQLDRGRVVVDLSGRVLMNIPNTTDFGWSQSGDRFMYSGDARGLQYGVTRHRIATKDGKPLEEFVARDESFSWSRQRDVIAYAEPSGFLVLYDLTTRQRRRLLVKADLVLAWALNDTALLVATNLNRTAGMVYAYKVHVLALATQKTRRLSRFDDEFQFWVAPNGMYAVFPSYAPDGLSILDLSSLRTFPVRGSRISGGPDDSFRDSLVIFSADSSRVYWMDQPYGGRATVFRARADGTNLEKVGQLPPGLPYFSPDLKRVVYSSDGPPPALWIADIDGKRARPVAGAVPHPEYGAIAWRPQQSAGRSSR